MNVSWINWSSLFIRPMIMIWSIKTYDNYDNRISILSFFYTLFTNIKIQSKRLILVWENKNQLKFYPRNLPECFGIYSRYGMKFAMGFYFFFFCDLICTMVIVKMKILACLKLLRRNFRFVINLETNFLNSTFKLFYFQT